MQLFFRQSNPEKRKMQDIQKCAQLSKLKQKNTLGPQGERILLESISPRGARTQLNIMKSSVRRALFSGDNKEVTEKQKMEFVKLTGEDMLYDSARSSRYHEHPEYLNHIMWTAKNFPNQEMRVKALAHLTLIARDMNYGNHPPGQQLSSVNDDILKIKTVLYHSLGLGHSYLPKTFIHEPRKIPDFQRWASGIAKWIKRAGLVLTPVYFAIGYMEGGLGVAKTLAVVGISAAIFSAGVVLNRLSRAFLNETKLMESLIRRALREREWNKKVRA